MNTELEKAFMSLKSRPYSYSMSITRGLVKYNELKFSINPSLVNVRIVTPLVNSERGAHFTLMSVI